MRITLQRCVCARAGATPPATHVTTKKRRRRRSHGGRAGARARKNSHTLETGRQSQQPKVKLARAHVASAGRPCPPGADQVQQTAALASCPDGHRLTPPPCPSNITLAPCGAAPPTAAAHRISHSHTRTASTGNNSTKCRQLPKSVTMSPEPQRHWDPFG